MNDPSILERVLRRDRAVTLVALLGASSIAWVFIITGAGLDMGPAPPMDMSGMTMRVAWVPSYVALMVAMWMGMMVAMMLPSAAPMVLLFATIERRRRGDAAFRATASFTGSYVLVWGAFALAATGLQWLLDRAELLSPQMATTSSLLAGGVLTAAGLYQFTPWKRACLRWCRSPIEFISRYWNSGPFAIGVRHGLYCVGCCWMLMLLLFVGGIMNLVWVAAIAAFILVEKVVPRAEWFNYAGGAALIAWGAWTLYSYALIHL